VRFRSRLWPARPAARMLAIALLSASFAPALAEDEPIEELGKKEFIRSCAACHGESAKGDGPVAELLLVPPPDLTRIRARHGGEFPASWVYRVIDGRNEIRPHGGGGMPIWGDRYRADALRGLPLPLNVGADAVVHGRILTLVFYLELIQE